MNRIGLKLAYDCIRCNKSVQMASRRRFFRDALFRVENRDIPRKSGQLVTLPVTCYCEPIRVVVTGAAGQIAYSLLYLVAKGDVFGPNQPLILHLLDIPPMMGILGGVVMELEDCVFPLLHGVVPTTDLEEAFKDASAVFFVGSAPIKLGMVRKDLLSENVKIFKVQGEALDKFAKKNVKVLVVSNPTNTIALVCAKYAPSIPKGNFTALTRLDQNRAQAQIAVRIGVPADNVSNVIIWGNHSATQVPDASHANVNIYGNTVSVRDAIKDDAWLEKEFLETVRKRGFAVMAARKFSSAMACAKASGDHMRDWFLGTAPGTFVSMGVYSDGSYGAPEEVVFSFPVTISDGAWNIVKDLKIGCFHQKLLEATGKELEEEHCVARTLMEP